MDTSELEPLVARALLGDGCQTAGPDVKADRRQSAGALFADGYGLIEKHDGAKVLLVVMSPNTWAGFFRVHEDIVQVDDGTNRLWGAAIVQSDEAKEGVGYVLGKKDTKNGPWYRQLVWISPSAA